MNQSSMTLLSVDSFGSHCVFSRIAGLPSSLLTSQQKLLAYPSVRDFCDTKLNSLLYHKQRRAFLTFRSHFLPAVSCGAFGDSIDTESAAFESADCLVSESIDSEACNAAKCQLGFDSEYQQTLGVDLGDRFTGVAVSWGNLGAPRALQVLQQGGDALIASLLAIAESEGADEIVVGLPLSATGTESMQASKSRLFAERLAAASESRKIRVYLFDESLTSKDAMAYMIKSGVKRKARKASLDSMAAAVLLESYFRDEGQKAERVLPGAGMNEASSST